MAEPYSVPVPHWRVLLEVVATAAMIVASTMLVWGVLAARTPSPMAPAQNSPKSGAPRVPRPLPSRPVSLEGAPIIGNPSAKIGVIEYSDFECPFCGRFETNTYPIVIKTYVESGKVRLVFRHLPLESKHAFALRAAEAAECSRRQGKFWPMHDALFAIPQALDAQSVFAKAQAIGLEPTQFRRCMTGEATSVIRQDMSEAAALGITATPTFLFGTVQPNGQLKVIRQETGAIPIQAFSRILDELLQSAQTAP